MKVITPGSAIPRIMKAEIIKDGEELALLVRETDGTVSAVRITVGQLAD